MTDFPVTEPQPAPTVFVDGYSSHWLMGGVARFEFFTLVPGPDGAAAGKTVLHLVTPLAGLFGIHKSMGELLAEAERAAKHEAWLAGNEGRDAAE